MPPSPSALARFFFFSIFFLFKIASVSTHFFVARTAIPPYLPMHNKYSFFCPIFMTRFFVCCPTIHSFIPRQQIRLGNKFIHRRAAVLLPLAPTFSGFAAQYTNTKKRRTSQAQITSIHSFRLPAAPKFAYCCVPYRCSVNLLVVSVIGLSWESSAPRIAVFLPNSSFSSAFLFSRFLYPYLFVPSR